MTEQLLTGNNFLLDYLLYKEGVGSILARMINLTLTLTLTLTLIFFLLFPVLQCR